MALSYNAYVFTLLMPPAILSYINADLGPDPAYTWISISWNLGGAIFVTIGGRLSDIFGRRYFFLAGCSLLVVGSIVGATGQTISQMIASGAIFGAGSGFLEMAYGAVQVCHSTLHIYYALPNDADMDSRKSFPMSGVWSLSVFSMPLPSSPNLCLSPLGRSSSTPIIGAMLTTSLSPLSASPSSLCGSSIGRLKGNLPK
jgi:MFS family permease